MESVIQASVLDTCCCVALYYEHLTKILRWTKFNADFQVECKRQFVTYVSIKQINKKSNIAVIKFSES